MNADRTTQSATATVCILMLLWGAIRASAFDESTVSDLVWWVSADVGISTNVGGVVTGWTDRSVSSNDASLLAGNPSLHLDVLNGQPGVFFDGNQDTLSFSRMTNLQTIFWVLQEDPAATDNYRPLLGDSTLYDFHRAAGAYFWDTGNASIYVRNGTTYTNGYSVGNGTGTRVPTVFSLITMIATGWVRSDQLGRDRWVDDRAWHGYMVEILAYSRALTSNETQTVGAYLAQKYNLSTAYLNLDPFAPDIINADATEVGLSSAVCNWYLSSTGTAATTVSLLWGVANAGTNLPAWQHTNVLGLVPEGTVSTQLVNLAQDTDYYYTWSASNSAGIETAYPAKVFRTAMAPNYWMKRQKIRFRGYDRSEVLTNFPALIVFRNTTQGFSYDSFRSPPFNDLRFLDSNSVSLAYDVEHWDSESNSLIWVRVPRLAGTNDFIWAYWSRSGRTLPAFTTNGTTWSQGFGGVWHFGEVVTNGGIQSDSSPFTNHGTFRDINGSSTAGANDGPLARSVHLSGDADYVEVGNGQGLQPVNAVTCELWARSDSSTWNENGCLLSRRDVYIMHCNKGVRSITFYLAAPGYSGVTYTPADVMGWHYYAGTYNGDKLRFYFDGDLVNTASGGSPPVNSDSGFLTLGRDDGQPRYLDGWIDEARVSTVARSGNWIWACWQNQAANETFLEYGPVESIAPPGILISIR